MTPAEHQRAVTDMEGACADYLEHLRRVAEKTHKLFAAGSAQERTEAAHDLRVEMGK
jgi:hypothetical protein